MSKRKLRSDTAAEAGLSAPLAPPVKKKRTAATRYLCFSCDEERTTGAFPNYNPTSECDHLINICKDCLKQWIEAQLDAGLFTTGGKDGKEFGIKCPQCPSTMVRVDIRTATGPNTAVYKKFDKLERNHIAENTPGWRWCLAPGCREGQVHEQKKEVIAITTTEPKHKTRAKSRDIKDNLSKLSLEEIEGLADICVCNRCGGKACVTCDRPYHIGETCEAFQARTKDRMDEEDKSIAEIAKKTRKCPGCSKSIEKNGGCPTMWCRECNRNFCWNCMKLYENVDGRYGCGCGR